MDVSLIPVLSLDCCFHVAKNQLHQVRLKQHGESPVLVLWDGGIRFIFDHVVPVKGVDFSQKLMNTVVKDLSELAFCLVFRGTGCRETSAQMTQVLLPASRMLKLGVLRRKAERFGVICT